MERRVASDGVAYVRTQFTLWYGTNAEYHWLRATPIDVVPGAVSGVVQPADAGLTAHVIHNDTIAADADVLQATGAPIESVDQPANMPSGGDIIVATANADLAQAADDPASIGGVTQPASVREIIQNVYKRSCVPNNTSWTVLQREHVLPISVLNWRQMLGAKHPPEHEVVQSVATFFPDEPDWNREGRPRLDIVLTFSNGHSARYHPRAALMWSTEQQPTDAMQKRMNYGKKLRAKHSA